MLLALLRPGRIDRVIYCPPPDLNTRKEILKLYLDKLPFEESSIDYEELGTLTEGFSGLVFNKIFKFLFFLAKFYLHK